MRPRQILTFSVAHQVAGLSGDTTVEYLTPAGTWSRDRDAAAVFKLLARTTPRERDEIRRRCEEWVKGEDAWRELLAKVDLLNERQRDAFRAECFPGGFPQATDAVSDKQVQDTINAAWMTWESPAKVAYMAAKDLLEQVRFYAQWPTIAREVPPGWEELGDCELASESIVDAIAQAYYLAQTQAEAGNV